jgi:two-component system cell cycle sensor histidine kinase/response regulator CckA
VGLTGVPFAINLLLYRSLAAPTEQFRLPEGTSIASVFFLELVAIGLLWMFAGAAYLTSQLLHETLNESYDTAADAIEAQQRLRQSEERYRLITENTSDLITLVDSEGYILYASPSHRQVLGYAVLELIGRPTLDMVHPDDHRPLLAERVNLMKQGSIQVTLRVQHVDGSWRWMETSCSLLDQQGNTVNVSRDITERKRLEAQLHQAQKMESIGRLAGGVAHDFNNLLTVMTGYAEMVRETLPPANPSRGDLEELLKAAERAASLTRQLLAFARKQIMEPHVLYLNDLILDMDRLLRRLIGEDIELVTRTASDLGLVKVDQSQIEQVLVNLAVNARDAMPQGGKLTIETHNVDLDETYMMARTEIQPGRYVLLVVSDTGVGMDAKTQGHVFEPFFTTKAAGKGTGLGLATCYGIIRQHDGAITVYSEVGHGTTFKIYLPQAAELPDRATRRDDAAGLPHGDETVLLVEDELAVRELAARVLRAQGYTVLEAANGDEALALAHDRDKTNIDLLLTDVIMPQIGGRELAVQLTSLLPSIKVLYMSGYTNDVIDHHGRLDPGIAFLHTPFSAAALTRKVREVLDAGGLS